MKVVVCVFLLLSSLVAGSALAQVPAAVQDGHAAPGAIPVQIEKPSAYGPVYELSRAYVPLSQVVRDLLPNLGSVLSNEAFNHTNFLGRTMGIKKGSEHEAALLRAILAAGEAKPDQARRAAEFQATRTTEGIEIAAELDREHLQEDAYRLGRIWGHFVADLGGEQSFAMVAVRAFLEQQRSGIALASDESFADPDHTIWKIERAFRRGMNEVLNAESLK